MINRFSARLGIVQALFEADVRKEKVSDIIKEWQDTQEQATENSYFFQVLRKFSEDVTTFDGYFTPLLSAAHGPQDPVILAILRGACAELVALKEEVPWRVVLNEYTNVAKRFSDHEGDASFVNALLDKVVSGQTQQDCASKTQVSLGCILGFLGLSLMGWAYPVLGWAGGKTPLMSYKTSLFVPMKPVCVSVIHTQDTEVKLWCKTLILEAKHSTDLENIHAKLPLFRDNILRDLWGRLHLIQNTQQTKFPSKLHLKQRLMTVARQVFGENTVIDIIIETAQT